LSLERRYLVRTITISAIVILIVAVAGFFFLKSNTSGDESCTVDIAKRAPQVSGTVTITHNDGGFSPDCVLVNSGTKINWINNDADSEIQIAVNPHPVHIGNKEISDGEFVLILGSGKEKIVTLTKVGKFGYHDHVNSSAGGTVIVE
jgi:plastocyanin